jgi:integrase/recombinase XerD
MKGVYQRGDRWWIRYRFNGKLIRQAIGDKKLAEETMKTIRRRIEDGQHEIKPRDERRTFAEMAVEYEEIKAAEEKRSLRCDRQFLKQLLPVFGNSFMHTITRGEIEAYLRIRRKVVSGATCNRMLALLKHVFNIAIEKGYVRDNPVRGIKKYKEAPWRRKYIYAEDELQTLVNAAATHLRPILVVAIGTGLRKGDSLALRWDQVDFEHNVITLFMEKTGEGIEIPMLPMVRETLSRLKGTAGRSPFVLTYKGRQIDDCRSAFNGALRRSGLATKGYHFHDIRRTFATMLYNRGVHLTKIQRLLGHKSITTTERYLGVKFEETAQAISVLDIPSLKALAAPQVVTSSVKQIAKPIEIAISRVS